MRFLSLFAGIGGFDLGLEGAGHECVGQVEIDGFCQRILGERFNAPRWTDVREWQGDRDEYSVCDESAAGDPGNGGRSVSDGAGRLHAGPLSVDLICGGFPCQDLSVAGKRAGLGGSRSGLFWEIIRIQKVIKAPWGLFENVPGLLSSYGGRDFWLVLQGLRECWPAVGYRILDSRYFGVAQRRRRVFLVCGPSEASVREVLFESEGGGGNPAKSGEAREGVARAIARGSIGSGYRYDPNGEDFVIGTIREHVRPGSNTDLSVVHSLRAEGHDANEDGTGRGTPIVATLNSGGNDGGFRTEPGEHLVSYGWNKSASHGMRLSTEHTPPLQAGHGIPPAVGVRRLTPLECERLQGFPDGWSCLCQPLETYREDPDEAAMRCKCPDSPRYRALGNAVTVNVIQWLGKRLNGHPERTAWKERRGNNGL